MGKVSRILRKLALRRDIRRARRMSYEIGSFITNHGVYPGVLEDCAKLKSLGDEIAEKERELGRLRIDGL